MGQKSTLGQVVALLSSCMCDLARGSVSLWRQGFEDLNAHVTLVMNMLSDERISCDCPWPRQ